MKIGVDDPFFEFLVIHERLALLHDCLVFRLLTDIEFDRYRV